MIEIYTDGACSGNPGPGGWGAYLLYNPSEHNKFSETNETKTLYGYDINTTNNRMELIAAIEALKSLEVSSIIKLYTDSSYLKNGASNWINKWQQDNRLSLEHRNPVKNIELWIQIDSLSKFHKVEWIWVKGHGDNLGNLMADKLANMGKRIAQEILSENMASKYQAVN